MKLLLFAYRTMHARKIASWMGGFIAALVMDLIIEAIKSYLRLG